MTSKTLAAALTALVTLPAVAQDAPEWEGPELDLMAEVKMHYRDSERLGFELAFPFPDEFLPPGDEAGWLRTPDPGESMEISNIALLAHYRMAPKVDARLLVHVLDLYNRNPTSTDDTVKVREAWLRFGHADDRPLAQLPGTTFSARVGRMPRFTKQLDRQLESYGLWGTAVGRFESTKIELGGSFGSNLYWRASWGNGNPLFMRDTNVLAGDNGTPESVPPVTQAPPYNTGFPILYDTWEQEVNFSGEMELGGGLGLRFVNDRREGVDVLAWHFQRDLADDAELDNTFYGGDLEILRAAGIPLPFSGDEKSETGVNLRARIGSLSFFGQYVDQEMAELGRDGFEAELSYRFRFPALFVIGDRPAGRWLELTARYSEIDNDFAAPPMFVAPSLTWDWEKLDTGLRFGLLREIDFTLEYSRHDMILASGKALHPDELLATLRFAIFN